MIELKHITKGFYMPDGKTLSLVLKDISVNVENGEALAITGPSGSGKSTLLNIMGLLDNPTSGQFLLMDTDPVTLSEKEKARYRNQHIGFIFQIHHLLPQCNVIENVLLPTLPFFKPGKSDPVKKAKELLTIAGLKEHMYKWPYQLSIGQSQRVAVVRALINSPDILLADEPTGSLDTKTSEILEELILELNRKKRTTLIVVTHSLSLARKMDRHYVLEDGILKE